MKATDMANIYFESFTIMHLITNMNREEFVYLKINDHIYLNNDEKQQVLNSLNDLKYLKLNTFDDLNNFSNYLAHQISL